MKSVHISNLVYPCHNLTSICTLPVSGNNSEKLRSNEMHGSKRSHVCHSCVNHHHGK